MSMTSIIFYFQLHQPFRLHPDRDKFFWDEENRELFLKTSERSYLPALRMFTDLIRQHPDFRITLSMSGIFLEQAQLYQDGVINALRSLLDAGRDNQQVEFLDETYYHSLTSLFADPHKQEFRDQVTTHRESIRKLFGIFPLSFRNTELMYNNALADIVADMGYLSILCEPGENWQTAQNTGSILPDAVYRAQGTNLIVIPRNRTLSNDVAFGFANRPLTPEQYAASIARTDGTAVLLGYDLEHIGGYIRETRVFSTSGGECRPHWPGTRTSWLKRLQMSPPASNMRPAPPWIFRTRPLPPGWMPSGTPSAVWKARHNMSFSRTWKAWKAQRAGPAENFWPAGAT